jgi:hypothetical protein
MKLKDLMEKYGEYEVTGIFDNDGNKQDGYVNVGLKRAKPKSVWDLKKGVDTYYYVDETGDVGISTWYDWECDRGRFNIGIAFLTEEEAEKDVERRRVETLLMKHGGRRWYKKFGENFGFLIDNVDRFGIHSLNRIQGTIYFDTYSDAETALDSIGADRIKDALFEVR